MTEVSHFELLLKPQAPSGPGSSGPQNVATVLQGYFLELTNLGDDTYRFRVELVVEPPGPNVSNRDQRTLAGKAIAFVDTATQNNQSSSFGGSVSDDVFPLPNGLVEIAPKSTALVAILPNAFAANSPIALGSSSGPPQYEVRGYVRLRLPATGGSGFRDGTFALPEPQSDEPVPVLATPQNRSTYLSFEPSGMGLPFEISDQTQASLPLATGQAKLEVEAEGPFFTLSGRAPSDAVQRGGRIAETLSDEARSELMLGQLATMNPDGETVKALNKALKEVGANVSVKKPK
jgi:hypothetical protein